MNLLEYRLVIILATALGIGLGYAIVAYRKERIRVKMFEQHNKRTDYAKDKRPPVLYLRPFSADGIKETRISFRWGFTATTPIDSVEMKLDKHLKEIGPFYAIGNPDNPGTEIGAVRENFTNKEWQAAVLERMKEASMIIFRPSSSPGILWEFDQLLQNNYLLKTIIAVRKEEESEYAQFRKKVKSSLPNLPGMRNKEMYVGFNDEWTALYAFDIRDTSLYIKLSNAVI
jgi:hypothetical protein